MTSKELMEFVTDSLQDHFALKIPDIVELCDIDCATLHKHGRMAKIDISHESG